MLIKRGILYAPDYVLNAGGIINIYYEKPAYDHQADFAHISGIYDNLIDLFRRADVEGLSPHLMADRMAEERIGEPPMQKIAAVGQIKPISPKSIAISSDSS